MFFSGTEEARTRRGSGFCDGRESGSLHARLASRKWGVVRSLGVCVPFEVSRAASLGRRLFWLLAPADPLHSMGSQSMATSPVP